MGGFSGLPDKPADLIDYIREAYHRHGLRTLDRAGELLSSALIADGETCQELYEVGRLLERYRLLLCAHLTLQESVLFAEALRPDRSVAAAERIGESVRLDLAALAKITHDLRMITLEYTGLPRGCSDAAPLLSALRELEADGRRHLYVEREILVPLLRDDSAS
ncbi:MAG: hypothetical protein GXX83_09340 [Gaiellales bacterium]|nr:hypothetical protein [Gaiellales bacterium]